MRGRWGEGEGGETLEIAVSLIKALALACLVTRQWQRTDCQRVSIGELPGTHNQAVPDPVREPVGFADSFDAEITIACVVFGLINLTSLV